MTRNIYELVETELLRYFQEDLLALSGSLLEHSAGLLQQRDGLARQIMKDQVLANCKMPKGQDMSVTGLLALKKSMLEANLEKLHANAAENDRLYAAREITQGFYEEVMTSQAKQVKAYRARIEEATRQIDANPQRNFYYVIAPVKTTDYTGVRIVMPVRSDCAINSLSLSDFVYTVLCTESTLHFQQEVFGDANLEFSRYLSARTGRGSSFHAIDILVDDSSQNLASYMSTLASMTAEALSTERCGKESETSAAGLTPKPIVFPLNLDETVREYMVKSMFNDFEKLLRDFFAAVLKITGSESNEAISVDRIAETVITLEPYRAEVANICQRHRRSLLNYICNGPLGLEVICNEESVRDATQWIPVQRAKESFFIASPPNADKTFQAILDHHVVTTKVIDGVEHVSLEDMLGVHKYVACRGRSVIGVYDEPVVVSRTLADSMGWDPKKLNELIKSGVIPSKEIISKDDGTPQLYIIRESDIETVKRIFIENT
ncbi:hypothetical protein KY363_00055 [Candidatus Woesearchaeota archaeon]|nr:hypothetical protein [Candidatus Woesearchaeota archaeon]